MEKLGKDIFKIILSNCSHSRKYPITNIILVCKYWLSLWNSFNNFEKKLIIINEKLFSNPYFLLAKYIIDSSYNQTLNFSFLFSEANYHKERTKKWDASQRGYGYPEKGIEKCLEIGWFNKKIFQMLGFINSSSSPNTNFNLSSKQKIIGRLTYLLTNKENIELTSISNSLYFNSFIEPTHPLIKINYKNIRTLGGIIHYKINLKITVEFIKNFFKNNPQYIFTTFNSFEIYKYKKLNYKKRLLLNQKYLK